MNNMVSYDVIKKMLGTEGHPYCPEAETMIEDFSADYGVQLVLEAARVAKQGDIKQINPIHVEEAKRRLRSIERRNWKKRLYGQSSGVLLGVGLSTLVPILSNISQTSILTLTICVVSALVGTAFLMYDALT